MLITAKIKTNSKKFSIREEGGVLHISLTEPAENNRANRELIKELTRRFGYCRIVRGMKRKTKLIEIPDALRNGFANQDGC